MAKKTPDINLLKTGNVNVLEQVVSWAVSIGRVIIILVELVALSAFIFRFTLDRQIIDLHTKIKQEQAIIEFFSENEKMYRNLQDRLLTASTFSSQSENKIKVFNDFINFTPDGVIFNNLSIFEDRVRIDASTESVNSLSSFVQSLRKYPLASGFSVDKIENKPTTSLINFGITVSLKPFKK
jgi:hypothetical protein